MSKHVLSFLEVEEVVRLDSAIINQNLRDYLHASFNETVLKGAVDFRHLDWCRSRSCSAQSLRLTGTSVLDNNRVDAPNFEVLKIRATAKVSDHALPRLLSDDVNTFEVLDIQSFYCISHHRLLSLDTDLSLLEIHASNNIYLREVTLVVLVKHCPNLRVLQTAQCGPFTENLPLALARHCPHLREVAISADGHSYASQTEQVVTGFNEFFSNCKELQIVDCSGYLTLADFQTLADNCKGLTSVKFQCKYYFHWDNWHIALADVALSTLVQNNPQIHTLELSHLRRLSDVSLIAVAQCLPDLHTFVLKHCQAPKTGLATIRNS